MSPDLTTRLRQTKPKLPLMELWSTILLPELDALIQPDGPWEGAVVVHQEDNAGIQSLATSAIRSTKMEVGAPGPPRPLHKRPRSPDVFPAMSKRHSELLQMYSNNDANAEKIWKVACQFWKSCSSSMVSRTFIQAYRIMQKIMLISQHPRSSGVSARVRKSRASQGQARQTKSNRENWYVIKVMKSNREGGQVLWSARTKGCPKPFNWSIINLLYIYYNL